MTHQAGLTEETIQFYISAQSIWMTILKVGEMVLKKKEN